MEKLSFPIFASESNLSENARKVFSLDLHQYSKSLFFVTANQFSFINVPIDNFLML